MVQNGRIRFCAECITAAHSLIVGRKQGDRTTDCVGLRYRPLVGVTQHISTSPNGFDVMLAIARKRQLLA